MTLAIASVETAGAVVRAALWPAATLLLALLFRVELRGLIHRLRNVTVATPVGSVTAVANAERVAALLEPSGRAHVLPRRPGTATSRVVWLGPARPAVAARLRQGGLEINEANTPDMAAALLRPGDVLLLGETIAPGSAAELAASAAERGAATVAFDPIDPAEPTSGPPQVDRR